MGDRIVVTGAAGFIGSALCERLLAAGHRVIGLDSFDTFLYPAEPKRRNAAHLATHEHFSLVHGDVRHASDWDHALHGGPVRAVVHLAGLAGVRPSLREAHRYEDTNAGGTIEGLEAVRRHGVPHFVFASSSSVYGQSLDHAPFREDGPLGTLASPYAASKRAAELQCEVAARNGHANVTVLRLFTVYGPGQRPDMAIASFVEKMRRDEPISLYERGTLRRDFTFVGDVVRAIESTLEKRPALIPAHPFRIYNIGGERPVEVRRVVDLLEAAMGRRANRVEAPGQEGDVTFTAADTTRVRAELGWQPVVPIEEGLKRYVASLGLAAPSGEGHANGRTHA